jgi:hypothetical protein
MYRLLWLPLTVCLASTLARADDAADARAVLDKAIKALGGADQLAKHPAVTWKSSGTITANDMKIAINDQWSAQGFDRFRWEFEVTIDGRALNGLIVIKGAEGWLKIANQPVTKVPAEVLPLLKNGLHIPRLVDALLPLRDKAFKLAPLGELTINDRAAVGIKVSHKDYPDVDLFFDKETALPLRSEFRVKEPMATDETTYAFYFDGYKEFGGRKFATKITFKRDDKTTIELERKDVTPMEKLDDSTFAKPE